VEKGETQVAVAKCSIGKAFPSGRVYQHDARAFAGKGERFFLCERGKKRERAPS